MHLANVLGRLRRFGRDDHGFGPHFNSLYVLILAVCLFFAFKFPCVQQWRMVAPGARGEVHAVEERAPLVERVDAGPWVFEPEAGAVAGRWHETTGTRAGGWVAFGLLVFACGFLFAELGGAALALGLVLTGGALATNLIAATLEPRCRVSAEGVVLTTPLGTRAVAPERIERIEVVDEQVRIVVKHEGAIEVVAGDALRARALAAGWRAALLAKSGQPASPAPSGAPASSE